MYVEMLQAEVQNPNNQVTVTKFMHNDHGRVYCLKNLVFRNIMHNDSGNK